jgi:hypothetical protein
MQGDYGIEPARSGFAPEIMKMPIDGIERRTGRRIEVLRGGVGRRVAMRLEHRRRPCALDIQDPRADLSAEGVLVEGVRLPGGIEPSHFQDALEPRRDRNPAICRVLVFVHGNTISAFGAHVIRHVSAVCRRSSPQKPSGRSPRSTSASRSLNLGSNYHRDLPESVVRAVHFWTRDSRGGCELPAVRERWQSIVDPVK